MIHSLKYPELRVVLDAEVTRAADHLQEALQVFSNDPYVNGVMPQLHAVLTSKGKRARGYILLLAYATATQQSPEKVLRAAVGVELFHLFCMIHDDIIDQALNRRGVATLHQFTEQWLKHQHRQGDLKHIGASQAILWGDLVLALASQLIATTSADPEKLLQAQLTYQQMFTEVVLGQIIDTDMMTRSEVSLAEVNEKTLLKTALYTFVRPMQLGFALAGSTEATTQFAERFGRALGMAFQVQDDLFDATLTEQEMGKPVCNDVQSGQHTVLSDFIANNGTEDQKKLLDELFGSRLTQVQQDQVRQLFAESGAVDHAKTQIAQYIAEAEAAIPGLDVPEEYKVLWIDFVSVIKNRTS
jgi:geranylgeranyl diphosphate synthase, type I